MSAGAASGRAESIRQRLRNELRARGEDVTLGLQRYAVERFLYRLGQSQHRRRFVLKGATLFAIWGTTYRPTRDIDFTGYGSAEPADVIRDLREICDTPDAVDQLVFDTANITAEPIRNSSEYDGLRIRIRARLGESDIPVQIDVGFGNAIVPGPEETEYRTILGDPPPRILAYPRESVVAEKLNAMVTLGERNSRYKDFYDMHAMANAFQFDKDTLVRAVRATFERRSTPIDAALPLPLTAPFYASADRSMQWRAYLTRNGLNGAPTDFQQIGDLLTRFLQPVWESLGTEAERASDWSPGGPWSTRLSSGVSTR
ncbi:MAG TPA: nucleotidyl transferase AbiEii/AbiGii toxin family protein [Steroidobacteraceae bacterium]|jgi:predicted nucleotidyltransferase component of viral defense system|nr:nucleotidyl transferase AbiEii/AbiGii toxin family protein [Steroidobacteraceae bacterium]